MLSINTCRELLGDAGRDLADSQVEAIRDQLQVLAGFSLSEAESGARSQRSARIDAWERIPAEDLAEVHERAAIMEFDAGLARDDAERRAFELYCDRWKESRS